MTSPHAMKPERPIISPLRPIITATREAVSLDGLWSFAVDHDSDGIDRAWFAGRLPGRAQAPVPSSVNDLFPTESVRNHVGYWWFQREARVPRGWDDGQVLVRFGSATHQATVWVDDVEVGRHKGGYLPFEIDVTDHVRAGEEFRLTVAVDNRLDNTCIPPGWVTTTPDGRREQHYLHDFYNYTGLHRSVQLVWRPARHVTDVTITTGFDGDRGVARWSVAHSVDGQVMIEIVDRADGAVVASGTGAEGEATVDHVKLWTPGVGNLYDLVVRLVDGDTLVDEYRERFGFRTVEVRGTQFLINGEPFYFTGFGMHEDHETIGKGHNDAHLVQDMELLAWIGGNSLRTSHYPYSEEWMDYCDEHGIVVIDETPAVGLNWMMAGGLFDTNGGGTYEEGRVDARTQAQHKKEIEGLISRDKNRPSVVLWSIANEPDSAADESRDYFEPLFALARECDPTRPVGFVNVMFAPADKDKIADLADVIMLNRYFGWYVQSGDLATAELAYSADTRAWVETYHKPIIMTEFGADTVAGLHSVYDQPFTEDYQVAYLEMCARVFDSFDEVIGEQMWNFADFQTSYGVIRVDGNKKGAFTRDRRPKAAARWLRKRWLSLHAARIGRRSPLV